MNHGSRESGSGIAPRACMPIAIASYSSWSVVAQSRYSDASSSRNMIPNIDGCPVKWYGDAGRVEDLLEAVLEAPPGGVDRLEGVRVPEDPQGLDRGRRGDPVAGVRAAVADLVGQDAHDLAPAAERRGRVAVAHRLGVRREVRRDAEELGRAALARSGSRS